MQRLTASADTYASLTFNVGIGAATKSATADGTEAGNSSRDNTEQLHHDHHERQCIKQQDHSNNKRKRFRTWFYNSDNTWSVNANMVVKATSDLYVTAIANADYSTFASCSTLGEVQSKKVSLKRSKPCKSKFNSSRWHNPYRISVSTHNRFETLYTSDHLTEPACSKSRTGSIQLFIYR
jgi:hypothetical protein